VSSVEFAATNIDPCLTPYTGMALGLWTTKQDFGYIDHAQKQEEKYKDVSTRTGAAIK